MKCEVKSKTLDIVGLKKVGDKCNQSDEQKVNTCNEDGESCAILIVDQCDENERSR